ncbi:MAG: hypothetical protein DI623_10810 [Sphingomonas sanxanigenens]|uniref:Uncharacterized protein n=1 Tax=Sphingomonas sanxanigenens TaxID=397260 RepID=A0A2W5A7Q4_9SPHN|nr:MAG: hypothetical protein DI623_10810 [Sphingomonas sanxanigenens]
MMQEGQGKADATDEAIVVRFSRIWITCMVVMGVAITLAFGYAGFNPPPPDSYRVRFALLGYVVNATTWGGIAWAYLLCAAIAGFGVFIGIRRWVDEIAWNVAGDAIRGHWSLWAPQMTWNDIEAVSMREGGLLPWRSKSLLVEYVVNDRIKRAPLPMSNLRRGDVERFLAVAEEHGKYRDDA